MAKEGKETKNVRSLIKEDVNHRVKDIKTIDQNLDSEQLHARFPIKVFEGRPRGHDGYCVIPDSSAPV